MQPDEQAGHVVAPASGQKVRKPIASASLQLTTIAVDPVRGVEARPGSA